MKYLIYCILAFISCLLFLPKAWSTEIWNIPILVFIVVLIAIYCIYKYIKLIILISRVRAKLKKEGIRIWGTRFSFWKECIITETENEVFNVSLLVRRKSYYRYHFKNENRIEFFKSTFTVYKSSKKGTIAQAMTEQILGVSALFIV